MKKSISHKITVLTFSFTLMMVAYHARTSFISQNKLLLRITEHISSVYEYLGCISMAFFFTMTGYLFYRNITKAGLKGKIQRRIKSLLIPLTAWNVIYLVGFMVFDRESVRWGVLDVIYHFTFAPYDGPLWYLFAIFMLTLFAPLVLFTRKYNTVKVVLLIAVFIIPVAMFSFDILKLFGLSEEPHFVMWLNRLFRYLPCYTVGSIAGMHRHDDVSTDNINVRYRIGVLALIVLTGFIWVMNPDIQNFYRQLIIVITPIFVWIVLKEEKFEKYNNQVVRNSFLIYATHFMVIFVYREISKKLVPATGDVIALLVWIAEPILCVILTYFCCTLFDRFIKKTKLGKIESVLTGSRT